MRNLISIINDAKKNAISGSKLIAAIKADEKAKDDFNAYVDALETVFLYEGAKNVWAPILKNRFQTLEPSQFVKFLALNCKDTQKIDGTSILAAVKTTLKAKELKQLEK